MSNEADMADKEYEPHFKAALANSKNRQFPGNSCCKDCDGPNDRPQYAICSVCFEDAQDRKISLQ